MSDSDWTIIRLRKLLAREWCPVCALLPTDHDDTTCEMRYYKGENNDSTSGNHQEEQGLLQEELQSA